MKIITNRKFSDTTQKFYNFEGDIRSVKTLKVVRPNASKSYRLITNVNKLKSTIRAGEYTFPGGYKLFFITKDGACLSFKAVIENLTSVYDSIKNNINDGWQVIGLGCSSELDEELFCDHTNESLN